MKKSLLVLCLLGMAANSHASAPVFLSDFESGSQAWSFVYGCVSKGATARSGEGALRCGQGSSVLISASPIAEAGVLELWIKPESPQARYRLSIFSSPTANINASWEPIAVIEQEGGEGGFLAKRIAIDEAASRFLRLDIDSQYGDLSLDDISISKIELNAALQKNQQKILSGILEKIKEDQDYQLHSDSIDTLATGFANQLDTQRQYLEYANGIYSTVTFVLATSERNKMANPLAYNTFKGILSDTKRVASPLQQARLSSMIKPFGDLVGATLNVVSAGAYSAFAEPFKSFLAASFDSANISGSELSRQDKQFARNNGLAIYQKADKFMGELERELLTTTALDNELQQILKSTDSFRSDLDKFMAETLNYGGLAPNQEIHAALMSKDSKVRSAVIDRTRDNIKRRADTLVSSRRQTDLVQYLLRTSSYLDTTQGYKERFNGISAQMLTFYDRFERSVAPEMNPFSEQDDRALWEQQAIKVRAYIKASREAFVRAYM